jgi:hypothetical protein
MLDSFNNKLINSLLDIANNIQIQSDSIFHPNYEPFIFPSVLIDRFQHTGSLQNKYLTLVLRNLIYGIYYNASLENLLIVDATHRYSLHQNLESTSIWGIDWEFYEELNAHNHSTGFYNSGWQVVRIEPDGSMAVTKGGLTMHIEPDLHLEVSEQSIEIGDEISVLLPKNRLHSGYYVAVSNATQAINPDTDLGVGRIYFNVTPSGAIALMDILTTQLNSIQIPFSFQVLYNKRAYSRYDSGVLHFERQNYPAIREILQEVYTSYQSYFYNQIPLFTKYLAPGLSLAEEPTQKFTAQESFGINRCQVVANALWESWQHGNNSIEGRMTAIRKHFAECSINLEYPYLNPKSEDIYQSLNL